jgi:hypothetical protein
VDVIIVDSTDPVGRPGLFTQAFYSISSTSWARTASWCSRANRRAHHMHIINPMPWRFAPGRR